jgi:hypothetical protein
MRYAVLAALVALPSYANLIRNPSFEMIPGPVVGQGILPSEWIQLGSVPPVADTYSSDGSYGLLPADLGNFPGVTAFDGIRWVAGGSGGIPAAPVPEEFGQVLTTPLFLGRHT